MAQKEKSTEKVQLDFGLGANRNRDRDRDRERDRDGVTSEDEGFDSLSVETPSSESVFNF